MKRCNECSKQYSQMNKNPEGGCTPPVIQINNDPACVLFHKVVFPASIGDDTTNPPSEFIGKYKNVLLVYEANNRSYMFSSDGMYTQLNNGVTDYEEATNLPQINSNTLIGDKTGAELGLQDKLTTGANIQIDSDNVISATDTTYGPATDESIGLVKPGDGLSVQADGTLDITDIEEYAHFFDTVADMKAAENLIAGSFARTLGYHDKNDGGGALYKIRNVTNDDTIDEAFIIEMEDAGNQLVAELILDNEINVCQLGAYGDGTHDDTARIQLGLDYCDGKGYILTAPANKTFLISSPLEVNENNVDFNKSTIKVATAIDVIQIENPNQTPYTNYVPHTIKNVRVDMNSVATMGINIVRGNRLNIESIDIVNNTTIGLKLSAGSCTFKDSRIYGTSTAASAVGLQVNSSDSIFTDLTIIDCKTACKVSSFTSIFTRIHAWLGYVSLLAGSKMFDFVGSCTGVITDCIADTYQYVFYQESGSLPQFICKGLQTVYANWIWNHETLNQDAYIIYANNIASCKHMIITNSELKGFDDTNLHCYLVNSAAFTGKLSNNKYFAISKNVANALTSVNEDLTTVYNNIKRSGDIVEINALFKYDAAETSGSITVGTIPTELRPAITDGINTVTFITGSQWSVTEMTPANMYALQNISVRLPASLTSGNKYIHINLTYLTD